MCSCMKNQSLYPKKTWEFNLKNIIDHNLRIIFNLKYPTKNCKMLVILQVTEWVTTDKIILYYKVYNKDENIY